MNTLKDQPFTQIIQGEISMQDSLIEQLLKQEEHRQRTQLNLIASENLVSRAVLQAQASLAINKYAEGYPGKRYYAGCEIVDQMESLAISRAKKLFEVGHVNMQPHAGASANLAAMLAMLEPGDTFMGLNLSHGGHLSHGCPVNISGRVFSACSYQLGSNEYLDMDAIRETAMRERPKMIIAGFTAYARFVPWEQFRSICDEIGAYLLADISHTSGLIAGGVYPSPVPYADVVTTTTHKTLRGPRSAMIMVPRDASLAKKIDKAVFPGLQGGPLMNSIAAKAVCLHEALQPSFHLYQQKVVEAAKTMADRFMHHGFEIVSGGTDSHQFTVRLPGEVSGLEAEAMLAECGVLVNKNTVPGDARSPWVTSGIRVGTPTMISRGMLVSDAQTLTDHMALVLAKQGKEGSKAALTELVASLCATYDSVYPVR